MVLASITIWGNIVMPGGGGRGRKAGTTLRSEPAPSPLVLALANAVRGEDFGSGLQVSGVVKNTGTSDGTQGLVGVIAFDGSGNILGALIDNTDLGALRAGQSKGFKTSYPESPPLKPTQVKSYRTFAFDFAF